MSDDCNDSLCSLVPSLNFSLQLPCCFASDLSKENLLFSTLAKEIIWGWFSGFQNKPILIGCMLFSYLILLLIIFWLLLITFFLSVLHVIVVDVMKFLKLNKIVLLDLHSIYVSLNTFEKNLRSELFDAKRNSLLGKWQTICGNDTCSFLVLPRWDPSPSNMRGRVSRCHCLQGKWELPFTWPIKYVSLQRTRLCQECSTASVLYPIALRDDKI